MRSTSSSAAVVVVVVAIFAIKRPLSWPGCSERDELTGIQNNSIQQDDGKKLWVMKDKKIKKEGNKNNRNKYKIEQDELPTLAQAPAGYK